MGVQFSPPARARSFSLTCKMPGIAGIVSRRANSPGSTRIKAMVQRMHHEPAQVRGDTAFAELGVLAGWVFRAGFFAGSLPAWNEDRTVCLIFVGEDFACHTGGR